MLLFLDLETTGLKPTVHQILEVAALAVSDDLRTVHRTYHRVLSCWSGERAAADPVVQKMHDDNGLWLECAASSYEMFEVRRDLLSFIEETSTSDERPVLAGNSIHFDRAFLAAHMPRVVAELHYRQLDVTSLNELARRVWPEVYAARPETSKNHRALADAHHSLTTARYYAAALQQIPSPNMEHAP